MRVEGRGVRQWEKRGRDSEKRWREQNERRDKGDREREVRERQSEKRWREQNERRDQGDREREGRDRLRGDIEGERESRQEIVGGEVETE